MTVSRVLKAIERRVNPPPPPATGPVEATSRHLSPAVAETVAAWFRGEIETFELSGERSVLVAHPELPEQRIKIKGAGYKGQPLAFSQRHNSELKAPRFDFDGRMMEDVAAGHDNTYFGGASFQQTVVEYAITQRLTALGYDVVPCLGHGQVSRQGRISWFSVFEIDPACRSVALPYFTIEAYLKQMTFYGAELLDMACRHGLIGYYWYVGNPEGGPALIKDVHPFYTADPINMSQIAWVMQVLFALHIVALTPILMPRMIADPNRPADAQAHVFRSFCPEATHEDHEALRWQLIGPYMRGVPKDFDVRKLEALLKGNPITAALMERCPPEYARL